MNLILFGFKASGKTHFGKLLALKMGRSFIDTDDLIAAKLGSEEFQVLEREMLLTLKKVENSIIVLGEEAILDPQNVEILQTIGALVFLKVGAEKLKKRIFQEEVPEGSFWEMVQKREPIYRSIPARCIDTDLLDEAGVLAALSSILVLEDPPNGF